MEIMKGDAFSEVVGGGGGQRGAALSRDALLHEGTRLIKEPRMENSMMQFMVQRAGSKPEGGAKSNDQNT